MKFTFIVFKSSSSLSFRKSVILPIPAKLMTRSTSQFSVIFSNCSISVKSYFIHVHSSKEFFSSSSFFSKFSLFSDLASKYIFLLLPARFLANSFPIPELAPVIKIFSITSTSLLFYLDNSSLTSINANPKRFSPFHLVGFSTNSSSADIPIPQILS